MKKKDGEMTIRFTTSNDDGIGMVHGTHLLVCEGKNEPKYTQEP